MKVLETLNSLIDVPTKNKFYLRVEKSMPKGDGITWWPVLLLEITEHQFHCFRGDLGMPVEVLNKIPFALDYTNGIIHEKPWK